MLEDRIHISLPGDLSERLAVRAAELGIAPDELVEQVLSDESQWRVPPAILVTPAAPVFCECCRPGVCRIQFDWRGRPRCGCSPERIATLDKPST
jgi:hypothetical protein